MVGAMAYFNKGVCSMKTPIAPSKKKIESRLLKTIEKENNMPQCIQCQNCDNCKTCNGSGRYFTISRPCK